jgi:MoxR-vWA-beta-propeller ternary system domain bpX3
MKLTLQHKILSAPQNSVASAAFIRGNSPKQWLMEISRWDVLLSEIDCYILPESIQSVKPAGLFVIIKTQGKVRFDNIMEPYTCASGALYIPEGTQLYPPMNDDELTKILVWAVQVFHPTIGFVGFTKKDKIDLLTFINRQNPLNTAWNFAKSGNSFRPPLTEISYKPVTSEDVMTSITDAIQKKSLSDIPKDETNEPSDLTKLMDDLKRGILKTTLSAIEGLSKMSSNTEGGNSGNSGDSNQETIGDKIYNWVKTNLDDLEKKRNDEINRLLNLFDKDMDEALKYALPLDSPYMNRGEAPPSNALGRRSTNFSLGNLGGGGRVDGWDLGNHYFTLQEKYRRAADVAIAKKDYKKAAYIHANLLSDFQSAARVLEQGKYYQEAAILYKDHVKNIELAASCLERGGLTLNAIELYDQLKRYEKVGDLYQKIEQPVKAKRYFEESITAHLERADFMEAARIEGDKLKESDRERATLLRGWSESNQQESCLKQYFEKIKEQDPGTLPEKVKSVYEDETPKQKHFTLLNILGAMVGKTKDEAFRETARNIAYEVLAERAEAGNIAALQNLKTFLPNDRLIASDLGRFVHNNKIQKATAKEAPSFQLDNSIKWLTAACHRNQYVVLGMKNDCLHFVRGNWYGNFEYYSWENKFSNPFFGLILNQYASNNILIYSIETAFLKTKKLARNKYFDSPLDIGNTALVTHFNATFAAFILYDGSVCFLGDNGEAIELKEYYADGSLKNFRHYLFSEEFNSTRLIKMAEMFQKQNNFYSYKGDFVFRINMSNNDTDELLLGSVITKMTMETQFQSFRMAVITLEGCLLISSDFNQEIFDYDFFAKEIEPIDLKFINENSLVVIGVHDIHVYDVENGTAFRTQTYQNTEQKGIAILNTNDRHNFAVLSEEGSILYYDLEN